MVAGSVNSDDDVVSVVGQSPGRVCDQYGAVMRAEWSLGTSIERHGAAVADGIVCNHVGTR